MTDLNVNDLDVEVTESSEPVAVDEKEALRQSIERNEAEFRDAFEELTAAVKSEVTLSGQILERPVAWLVGGFAVGAMLAWRR